MRVLERDWQVTRVTVTLLVRYFDKVLQVERVSHGQLPELDRMFLESSD